MCAIAALFVGEAFVSDDPTTASATPTLAEADAARAVTGDPQLWLAYTPDDNFTDQIIRYVTANPQDRDKARDVVESLLNSAQQGCRCRVNPDPLVPIEY